MGCIRPQSPVSLRSGGLRCVKMPMVHEGFWGQVRGQRAESNTLRAWLLPSVQVPWEDGQPLCGEGSAVHSQLLPPPPAAGVLPSNRATLHLPSGIMSSPLRGWHKSAFLLLLTGLSFQFPIVLANGLTTRLPVTFPPLPAALEESLDPSDLQGRACGGRNATGSSRTCVTLWPSVQPSAQPPVSQHCMGRPPLFGDMAHPLVFLSPTPIKHMAVPWL